jgi:transposase
MSKTYRPYEPDQTYLLPPNLKEWLPTSHLAYFIDDLVDELDLSEITREYEGEDRGYPPYHPVMMTKVLVYGYCVGKPSSRRIQKGLEEDVAFRVLAAENRPDFRTISDFRKRHLKALAKIFCQVLQLCQKAGLVKLGHVALDGTKIKANASKHKAMSYERMCKTEAELEKEVERLLQEAERIDAREDEMYGRDKRGDELPEELSRRETRLKKIREAKKALEEEARLGARKKAAERAAKEAACNGKKMPGRPPGPIQEKPEGKAQRNFTDPDSRIMKSADKSFIQAYNAQAAVDSAAQIIVAHDVITNPKDAVATVEMVDQIKEQCGEMPKKISADAGNYSEDNVKKLQGREVEPFIASGKIKHNDRLVSAPRGRIPVLTSVKDRMARKLKTRRGRKIYAKRKEIVEPVFGQIKSARGFTQFFLRGHEKVRCEWAMICMGHNLLKLFRSGKWTFA